MVYDKQLEEKLKNRLKELRKKAGLTQETLVEAINIKYADRYNDGDGSDIIGQGTIKLYEAKGGKCSGMSIDTLCLLADFYDVSVEYILGLSDLETPDIDIKGINKKLRLSEEAIKKQLDHPFDQDALSLFIENKYYVMLMLKIHNFLMNRPLHLSAKREATQDAIKFAQYKNDEMQDLRIDSFETERYIIVRQFEALLDDVYKEKSEEYHDERSDNDESGCPAKRNEDGSITLLDDPGKYEKNENGSVNLNIINRKNKRKVESLATR